MTTHLGLSGPTVYGADRVAYTSWSEPVDGATLPASCSGEFIIRLLLPGRSGWRSPALFPGIEPCSQASGRSSSPRLPVLR